jgi:hypothetical protein
MPLRPLPERVAPAPERLRHNVPTALSSFVGRTAEAASLRETLWWSRLVSVVGAGGAGKTRLAHEVAAAIVREAPTGSDGAPFPDGVLWADLAPLTDGIDVAETLAALDEISPSSGMPVTDALVEPCVRSASSSFSTTASTSSTRPRAWPMPCCVVRRT